MTKGQRFELKSYKRNGKRRTLQITNVIEGKGYDFTDAEDVGSIHATPEFISFDGMEFYKGIGELRLLDNPVIEQAKAKVFEIQNSRHVKSVKIGFEFEADGTRFYSAITKDNGIEHKYTVRVWEESEAGETITIANCNCIANGTCRHIQQVAAHDAKKCNREIYPLELANYRAHKRAA